MADKVFDESINNFLKEAISPSPSPGGGNVAAVAAAMAASMVGMVASLTMGKKAYAQVEGKAETVLKECENLIEQLKELTHQDMAAYGGYIRAYRMPKDTEEQQAAQRAALETAAQNSTSVPLDICQACLEVIAQAYEIAGYGNKMAISDAGVGAYLALGALRSVMLTVEANLSAINDQEFLLLAQNRRAHLLVKAEDLSAAAIIRVKERMNS